MSDPNALYDEADRLKSEGKHEECVAKLREAIAIDGNFALGHSALAVALQKLQEHNLALDHARKVCELAPTDPFSFTALSVTYQRAYAATGEMGYIRLAEEAMEKSRQLSQRPR